MAFGLRSDEPGNLLLLLLLFYFNVLSNEPLEPVQYNTFLRSIVNENAFANSKCLVHFVVLIFLKNPFIPHLSSCKFLLKSYFHIVFNAEKMFRHLQILFVKPHFSHLFHVIVPLAKISKLRLLFIDFKWISRGGNPLRYPFQHAEILSK